MFTGIVEELATVTQLKRPAAGGARLELRSALNHSTTRLGDSIAIDGVCLTVVESRDGQLGFELADETLRRSTLGALEVGGCVHLERALRVGDRLGGYFVSGHVDTTVKLLEKSLLGADLKLVFERPQSYGRYLVEKGGVVLAGVALTLGEVSASTFSVYVIPHTREVTKLEQLSVGAAVNLEIDMVARYIAGLLEGQR